MNTKLFIAAVSHFYSVIATCFRDGINILPVKNTDLIGTAAQNDESLIRGNRQRRKVSFREGKMPGGAMVSAGTHEKTRTGGDNLEETSFTRMWAHQHSVSSEFQHDGAAEVEIRGHKTYTGRA